jgi:hypothetical protein
MELEKKEIPLMTRTSVSVENNNSRREEDETTMISLR